jgi:hypothetical protein
MNKEGFIIFDDSMRKMYEIISKKTTLEKLISESKEPLFFAFDPIYYSKDDLIEMEKYFCDLEDYEKCQVIFNLYKKRESEDSL